MAIYFAREPFYRRFFYILSLHVCETFEARFNSHVPFLFPFQISSISNIYHFDAIYPVHTPQNTHEHTRNSHYDDLNRKILFDCHTAIKDKRSTWERDRDTKRWPNSNVWTKTEWVPSWHFWCVNSFFPAEFAINRHNYCFSMFFIKLNCYADSEYDAPCRVVICTNCFVSCFVGTCNTIWKTRSFWKFKTIVNFIKMR